MTAQILAYALNNPLESIGIFLAVCFILFLGKVIFASHTGYNANENNIRRWG